MQRRVSEKHRELSQQFHLNSIVIDFYLWDSAKLRCEEMKQIPIHLTNTHFY